jgi:integrase
MDDHTFDPSDWQPEKLKLKRFDNLAEMWLEDKERRVAKGQFAEATYQHYRSCMMRHCIPFFGALDIRDIKKATLTDFFNSYLYNAGIVKQTSKQSYQIVLHSFLNWVKEDRELVKTLPPFPLIEGDESEPRRAMEMDEQFAVIQRIPQPFQDMIMFGMETGLRPAEICALQIRDIDQVNAEATIRRTFSKHRLHEKTKQKRNAVIPLTDTAMEIMYRHSASKLPTAFIFLYGGKPIFADILAARWKKYSGTNYTINEAMRHSFGSQLAASGAPIRDIQQLLRHKTLTTTEKYLHRTNIGQDRLRATITAIRTPRVDPHTKKENQS